MESHIFKNSDSKNLLSLNSIENKAGRFFSLSVLLHTALFASIVLLNVPPMEFSKKETVEFEIEEDSSPVEAMPEGEPLPETKGAVPAAIAPPAAPMTPSAPAIPPTPVTSTAPMIPAAPVSRPVVSVAPTAPLAVKAPVSAPPAMTAAPAPVHAQAPAAMPETLDDIQSPPLETSEDGDVPVAQMDEKDLQEDFEKVDQAHQKTLVLAKKSLDEEADKASAEGDKILSEMDKEAQSEAQAIAVAAEKRRAQDAAAIATAAASEKASAERAARLAAKEAADREAAQGSADEGEGSGGQGSPEPTKEVAGIPGGVRTLGQLRQMKGNKFPQYDKEERLARQEGEAVFYAYVNKDGTLSQFKLGESTGHRNLDAKTLAALKKWKFYPGQEGWVEMPFKWTLSGETMEAGGQLRNTQKPSR